MRTSMLRERISMRTADIFSGSEDGTVRYYQGLGYQDWLKAAAAATVTAGGEPLSVGSFS